MSDNTIRLYVSDIARNMINDTVKCCQVCCELTHDKAVEYDDIMFYNTHDVNDI